MLVMRAAIADETRYGWLLLAWALVCSALVGAAATLYWHGDAFGWERTLAEIPSRWLAGGLIAAGLVYALIVPLIATTLQKSFAVHRLVLVLVVLTGLAMRLIMVPSVPALEDDFYRYLWDGAVTANGYNPYALAPSTVRTELAPEVIRQLANDGAATLDRINHPQLKTIYPPVAQAAFALGYWIEPWSLRAWRTVCLIGECLSLGLILLLLGLTGRSRLWAALYWLNPLIVKELMNTAHMEAIVMPFVLGAVTLLALRRPVLASASLGLAIGAKLWPVMLLPLVLKPLLATSLFSRPPLARPFFDRFGQLLAALAILGLMAVAWALPPLLGGLGSDSGFVAYASHWQTNSALFQGLQEATKTLLSSLGLAPDMAGMIVRLATAGTVATAAVWLSFQASDEPAAIVRAAAYIVLAMFLLSPAQFPWYGAWVLVFAPFILPAGMIGLTVFLPLYYVSFYFYSVGDFGYGAQWLVWIEWLPIWMLLGFDAWRQSRLPLRVDLSRA